MPRRALIGLALVGLWACDDGAAGRDGDPSSDAQPDAAALDAAGGGRDADAAAEDAAPAEDAAAADNGGSALGPMAPLPGPATVDGERLATSGTCALCHQNAAGAQAMRDEVGAAIGPFDLWMGTMMANSARDPLWRAVVSAEVAATPAAREAIEAKCTRCHAAAGWHESDAPSMALIDATDTAGHLARDGVTCTVCHGIEPDGLGTDASFTGHWVIGDEKVAYGPHAQPQARPMEMHTGITPRQADHVTDAALCGSCHTLITDALTADGEATGHQLVEQATCLEWRNSRYPMANLTCQGCHMPTMSAQGVPLQTAIARNPGGQDFPFVQPRAPYGRHVLVGGNTLIPRVLDTFRAVLNPQATPAAFAATVQAARAQLARAARLEVGAPRRAGEVIELPVTVFNQAGHKLPSGIPTRRAWLRVTVRDAAGAVVFDSGAHDDAGRLVADGGVLPSELADGPIQPHHQVIERADQVQIYASVMCDPAGVPTGRLLRAAQYCQDDRLLPAGWRADHADGPRTAPVGTEDDPDFIAGQDTVTYRVAAPAAAGPYTVQAQLLYQTLGARFAADLFAVDTAEIRQLRYFLQTVPPLPEVIAEAELSVE